MWLSRQQARSWARGLGWFSVAVGSVELLAAPRGGGLRKIVNGVGLLGSEEPAPWMWARVAGDAADLVALARAPRRGRAMALGAAVAGVLVLDLLVARRLGSAPAAEAADYRRRSGLPLPPDEMRGAARADFQTPRDLVTPVALRPWAVSG